MPNSINIPLFDNEERSFIGKKYKNAGREKAVIEGFKIIENKLDNIIKDFIFTYKNYLSSNKNENTQNDDIRIYCARGGMRSQSINWLLEKLNYSSFTLKGGYKSYRNWVLNSFIVKRNIIVIGGKTGTGKTKILNDLNKLNYQILDFESLANHRGSSFGGLGMNKQPTNEQFENLIADQIDTFDMKKSIFVEAESANIGKCRIPQDIFKQMKSSKRIEIIKDIDIRIKELINTYSIYPKIELKDAVLRITKRLGPQRTKSAIISIEEGDWAGVCKAVLEYYDKCYDYELKNLSNLKIEKLIFNNEKQLIQDIIKKAKII